MTNMSKVWSKISGFKTILGSVLHAAWFGYYIWVGEVDVEMQWRGHGIIGVLTGVGLAHKAKKQYNNIKNRQDD